MSDNLFSMTNNPKKTIRFNEEELKEFDKAREILKIPSGLWGEDAEIIKKSIRFVIEFSHLFWEKFLNDYPPLAREIIKEKLK